MAGKSGLKRDCAESPSGKEKRSAAQAAAQTSGGTLLTMNNVCPRTCGGRFERRCRTAGHACTRNLWLDQYGFLRTHSGAKVARAMDEEIVFLDKRTGACVSVDLSELLALLAPESA